MGPASATQWVQRPETVLKISAQEYDALLKALEAARRRAAAAEAQAVAAREMAASLRVTAAHKQRMAELKAKSMWQRLRTRSPAANRSKLNVPAVLETLERIFRKQVQLEGEELTQVELWERALRTEQFAELAASLQATVGWAPDAVAREMVAIQSVLSEHEYTDYQGCFHCVDIPEHLLTAGQVAALQCICNFTGVDCAAVTRVLLPAYCLE